VAEGGEVRGYRSLKSLRRHVSVPRHPLVHHKVAYDRGSAYARSSKCWLVTAGLPHTRIRLSIYVSLWLDASLVLTRRKRTSRLPGSRPWSAKKS